MSSQSVIEGGKLPEPVSAGGIAASGSASLPFEVASDALDAGRPPLRVADQPALTAKEETPARNHIGLSLLLCVSALAIVAAGAFFGYDYWTVGRFEVSTDDAYVQADNIAIAPRVAGYISEVLVGDN